MGALALLNEANSGAGRTQASTAARRSKAPRKSRAVSAIIVTSLEWLDSVGGQSFDHLGQQARRMLAHAVERAALMARRFGTCLRPTSRSALAASTPRL